MTVSKSKRRRRKRRKVHVDSVPDEWPCSTAPTHDVDRWCDKHTDGVLSTFVRRNGMMIQTDEAAGDRAATISLGGEFVMFGKHKGSRWNEVPTSYLKWILDTWEPSKRTRRVIRTAKLLLSDRGVLE